MMAVVQQRRIRMLVLAVAVLLLGVATPAPAKWDCQRTSGGGISCAFCFNFVRVDGELCELWEGWCSDGWHDTGFHCW